MGGALHNFRDAGGLELPGGRVRSRVLFRSAAPLRSGGEADAFVRSRGIRSVIDLRDDAERAVLAPAWRDSGADVVHVPVFENRLRQTRFADLTELYAIMLDEHAAAIAAAVATIAQHADRVTLVHCTAGKDRTGVVIAIVHEVLGVDRGRVLAGYARSQQLLGQAYLDDLFRGRDPATLPGAAAHRAVSSPPELLGGLLEVVDARYGGALGLLRTHGVSDPLIERLRGSLVEPVSLAG